MVYVTPTTPNTEMFEWIFGNTTIVGTHWILPLILSIVIMAIVTVELQKWKIMLLPTLTTFGAMGLQTSALIYVIASIIFVNETFNIEIIGNAIRGIRSSVSPEMKALKKLAKQKKALQYVKYDLKKNPDKVYRATTSISSDKFDKAYLNKRILGGLYNKESQKNRDFQLYKMIETQKNVKEAQDGTRDILAIKERMKNEEGASRRQSLDIEERNIDKLLGGLRELASGQSKITSYEPAIKKTRKVLADRVVPQLVRKKKKEDEEVTIKNLMNKLKKENDGTNYTGWKK